MTISIDTNRILKLAEVALIYCSRIEAEKINGQRSPGSPFSLHDWIHNGCVWQSRLYCLQNLAPKAETFLTHSAAVLGVLDSVDFTRARS
jgi:hypothetical protein